MLPLGAGNTVNHNMEVDERLIYHEDVSCIKSIEVFESEQMIVPIC